MTPHHLNHLLRQLTESADHGVVILVTRNDGDPDPKLSMEIWGDGDRLGALVARAADGVRELAKEV